MQDLTLDLLDSFRKTFARVRRAAGLPAGIKFMHLPHTAVTRLAEAGATTPQICSVTGHGLKTCELILERYMVRTVEGARAAFARRMAKDRESEG